MILQHESLLATDLTFHVLPFTLLPLAYLAAGVVAFLGYRARALTVDGALAALLVGGTVFGFGGVAWAILLVLFFASSSALSFVARDNTRKQTAAETFEKGGTRDAGQVLANGGVAFLVALLSPFVPGGLALCAFVGALAAATADTWATEIGVLSRVRPRLITTWKPVAPGTSGGVTLLGSTASVAGAFLIGASAGLLGLLFRLPAGFGALLVAGLLGGTAGSLADSLAGATIQASYWCPHCEKPTESKRHSCGTPTRLVQGLRYVNNDAVNVSATAVGAIMGAVVSALVVGP